MATIKATYEDVELKDVKVECVVTNGDTSYTNYYLTFRADDRSYVFSDKDLKALVVLLTETVEHTEKRDW